MKHAYKIILILFLYLSNYGFTDGIDKVCIYLNGKYLVNSSEFKFSIFWLKVKHIITYGEAVSKCIT